MGKDVVSLANFEDSNPRCIVNSPRSLQACKQEGVLAQELVYKPPEAFQEKGLSPRLVKLRYDFFEAKRRDLLAATRRARDSIVAEEKREKGELVQDRQLEIMARESGLTKGSILALNGDTLAYERKKLLKAQENERKWLENALHNELRQLQTLQGNDKKLTEQANDKEAKTREIAQRMKELNDKRAQDEERKALEAEARQKLEKQIAKEEFHKQLEEIKRKAEVDAVKQKEAYQRQLREAERKLQREKELEEKREAAAAEQEARKNELRAQDLRRQEVMDRQKELWSFQMREKQEARDLRIYQSIQNNMELEKKRRDDFEEKCRMEALREEKLSQVAAERQEQSAKRSFQLLMRRKNIQDEAAKRAEERRNTILEAQEEAELRLLEHEQKKERYLDFKRELDGLRAKNKDINVERQRRKEEAYREKVAEAVMRKDDKTECLQSERARLWQLRRAAQSEAMRAREIVKQEIFRQRIASKFDAPKVEKKLHKLMKQEIFHPKVLQSQSMPTLVHPASA